MKSMTRWAQALALGAALMCGPSAFAQQARATENAPDGVKAAEKIPVDELPPRVRATVLREAGTKDVEWVAPQKRGTQTVYAASLAGHGTIVHITIARDGKLLSRSAPGMASRRPHHTHQIIRR